MKTVRVPVGPTPRAVQLFYDEVIHKLPLRAMIEAAEKQFESDDLVMFISINIDPPEVIGTAISKRDEIQLPTDAWDWGTCPAKNVVPRGPTGSKSIWIAVVDQNSTTRLLTRSTVVTATSKGGGA